MKGFLVPKIDDKKTPSNVEPFEPPPELLPPNGELEVETLEQPGRKWLFKFTFTRAADGKVFTDEIEVAEPAGGWDYPGWLTHDGTRAQIFARMQALVAAIEADPPA